MLRIQQLKLGVRHTKEELRGKIIKTLRIRPEALIRYEIVKRSLDARGGELKYVYLIDAEVKQELSVLKHCPRQVERARRVRYEFPCGGKEKLLNPPVIVGTGPAGLFCGLALSRAGYAPILLERGQCAKERAKTVEKFWKLGILDPQSNVCFGEGGAGTFSDGKLNTLVKDPVGRGRKILELFVEAGAPPEILYESRPHLGTDLLIGIVSHMRREIENLGGKVRFQSQVTELLMEDGSVKGVVINEEEKLEAEQIVLAAGHSARDTFYMLKKHQIPMQAKAFAVGVRVEHSQEMINQSQYGEHYPKCLPAASYKLTRRLKNGRGVYSFCMCPGGYVVNASSEKGMLAVNGMSYQARKARNANSAMIVTVTPKDFGSRDTLAGVEFQRRLERAAFLAGQGKIPVQLFADFCQNVPSSALGDVEPCTKGAYAFANVRAVLPENLSASIEEGIKGCGGLLCGFDRPDTVLSGVESRTSSPVRILRNENYESAVKGLYPCGEGAGYAGGIMSAAMDGLKIAEAIAKKYAPWYD